jgi:hypothetical protein
MRSKFARFLAIAVSLGCAGLWAVAQDPKAVDAITRQADDVQKKDWKDLARQGEAIAKANDLKDVMDLFKLRRPGEKVSGLGIGKTPGNIKPDGIEAKIKSLADPRRPPIAAATLEKEQADLIRMAEIAAAIASVSTHQCTVDKKMGDKDPVEWKKWMEEMHKEAQNLIKGLKDKKPGDIRNASRALNDTCVKCHNTFRDVP